MGRMKWPATYTWYFARGMQLSPALQSPVFFHLGCCYAPNYTASGKKEKVMNKCWEKPQKCTCMSNVLAFFPILHCYTAAHPTHPQCFWWQQRFFRRPTVSKRLCVVCLAPKQLWYSAWEVGCQTLASHCKYDYSLVLQCWSPGLGFN